MTLRRVLISSIITCLGFSASIYAQPVFDMQVVTEELEQPWSMAILPNSDMLITEKQGALKLLKNGKLHDVSGVPEVYSVGQGGLLDIKLAPDFSDTRKIFFSYATGNSDENALRVASAVLDNESAAPKLSEVSVILTVSPFKDTPVHYGGRMSFLPDGSVVVTSGDGFDYREKAQVKQSMLGKVLRVNQDGSTPADNPFFTEENASKEIYSLGHRNPQALLFDAHRNRLVAHEHGPAGGDEINIIEPGKNYGWPVITNGKDYSGANISPFREYPGMEQPFVDWTPSIAPSDMIVYTGELFPELQHDYLVTTLKSRALLWVDLTGNDVVGQTNLLTGLEERFRGIQQDKNGYIYLLTDSGKLLKLGKK